MVRQNLFIASIFLLVILSVGFANANTIIVGKIYNSDFSSTLGNANVHVKCGSDYLDTTSLSDGTYAVRFSESGCNGNSTAEVTANKAGFAEKKESGIAVKCEGSDCEENYISVINLGLSTASNSGGSNGGSSGGSSNHYYLCGNGICDSGETAGTCSQDCSTLLETVSFSSSNTKENKKEEPILNIQEQEEASPLTGAVTGMSGFVKSGIGISTVIGLLAILILAIFFFSFKKSKSVKKTKTVGI